MDGVLDGDDDDDDDDEEEVVVTALVLVALVVEIERNDEEVVIALAFVLVTVPDDDDNNVLVAVALLFFGLDDDDDDDNDDDDVDLLFLPLSLLDYSTLIDVLSVASLLFLPLVPFSFPFPILELAALPVPYVIKEMVFVNINIFGIKKMCMVPFV